MPFQVFRRRSRVTYSKPSIGVHRRGTLSFNGAAIDLLAEHSKIADKTNIYVQLLYDPEQKIVGLRSVPPESTDSYPVRKQRKSDSYLLSGGGFFGYHRIDVSVHRRYTARIYDGDVLGFSLLEHDDSGSGGSVKQ